MRSINPEDDVNNIRTNMIELLVRLYKKFNDQGLEVHLTFENKSLHYVQGRGLWLEGSADRVHVADYEYAAVSLGKGIRSYQHMPYEWLTNLYHAI